MERPYPFLVRKSNGKIWLAGKHWYGLCSAWNHATNPARPMLEGEHRRAKQYARAIKNRMEKLGYKYGVHYKELSNGELWPIQPKLQEVKLRMMPMHTCGGNIEKDKDGFETCLNCHVTSSSKLDRFPKTIKTKSTHTPKAGESVGRHTPGPWNVDGLNVLGGDDAFHQQIVAEVYTNADARLLASAPELLEALKGLLNEYKRARETINEVMAGKVSQEEARDAVKIKRAVSELIAKAEGRD